MRRSTLLLVLALAGGGCVLDSSHVSTRLLAVCTEDVPLLFEPASASSAVALVTIDDVGASIDDRDARATLDEMSLEELDGIDDFGFASGMTMDIVAPGAELPDARVAELASVPTGPRLVAAGDGRVDLVDYLVAETLAVRIELTGAPPAEAFSVLFDACLTVDGIEVTEP
jgi:hypothetical protein